MQAFERGEEIEYERINIHDWTQMRIEEWNFETYNYRIKPKPKQTVVIEKWLIEGKVLCSEQKYLQIVETSNINGHIRAWGDYKKNKTHMHLRGATMTFYSTCIYCGKQGNTLYWCDACRDLR